MNDIAIRVENLGKLYRIGSRQNGYKTLRESITNAASSPFRLFSSVFGNRTTACGLRSAVGSPDPTVDGRRSAVSTDQSAVGGQRSLVGTDQSSVSGQPSAVASPDPTVGGQPSAVASPDPAVCGLRSSVDSETLWALKNISFDVRRGEVVGVIGRNGAGKSTLLKILSRITEPSEGYAEIRGRVGSLLEVGTGFHAELSGRENIYLSGAILGMRKAEIERKFDEIVAFAEIEKFLDTPVKHYSSGMYVRLAFAVAAHLDPEILLVDEVLAVGDMNFQKKCLGKMGEISQGGRTVLFVSHNMQAIKRLCNYVIFLNGGRLENQGRTDRVIKSYLYPNRHLLAECSWADMGMDGSGKCVGLLKVRATDDSGTISDRFDIRRPICIEIFFRSYLDQKGLAPGLHIYNEEGVCLFMSYDHNRNDWHSQIFPPGLYQAKCMIPGNLLAEGIFFVSIAINTEAGQSACHAFQPQAICFEVYDPFEGDSVRGPNSNAWGGVMRPMLAWETQWINSKVYSGGIQPKDMAKEYKGKTHISF